MPQTMYYDQFAQVDSTNDDLEDLQNFRNLGYLDGSYYWTEADTENLYVKKTDAITGTTSTEHTYNFALISPTVQNMMCRINKGKIFACVAYKLDRGAGNYQFDFRMSWHDGTSWNDRSVVSGLDPDVEARIIDMFYAASTYYALFTHTVGGTVTTQFENIVTSDDYFGPSNLDDVDQIYGGGIDENDDYRYLGVISGDHKIVTFDTTAHTSTTETITLTAPGSYNVDVQQYFKLGNIEIRMDVDNFDVREGGSNGTFVPFTDTGTTTNGIVWKFNDIQNIIPSYIIWKDTIYWINKNNRPLPIQQTTEDAYVGWEDWFSNGADAIFQIELTDIEVQGESMKVDRHLLEPPRCSLISTIEPFQNQFIQIKDSTGFVHFQGKIATYAKDLTNSTYEWNLKSLIKLDLDPDNKITDSYDTKTFPFILDDFLTNYAKGLWHGKGTNALVTDFTSAFITANKTEGVGCTVTLGTTNYFLNGKMDSAAILYDNGAGTAALDIPSISGTTVVSFSIATSDITNGTTIEVYEGANRIGYILIDTSTVYWYDGVAEQDLTITTVNNTIIHIVLVFSAADDDVDIYVDGVSNSTQDLETNITTEISKLTIVTNAADTGYYSYIGEYYLGNSIVEALNTYDSISTLLTTTYTKSPKSQNFRSLCKEIMRTTGYIITWTNEDQLYLDQYRPSTYHITDANFISAGKPMIENEPYSSVKIFGGFVNGSQLEAKKDSDPTLNPIFDWFPLIEDQTELDTKVAQMATNLNVKITKLNPILYNIPFLQMGEYITITSTAYGYTASTGWLVCYLSSQPTHNIITPALSDVFYQGTKKTTDSDRVVNNEQNIAVASGNIQTNVSDIGDIKGFLPCEPAGYGAGATVGYITNNAARNGWFYLPNADNNCLCWMTCELPDWVTGDETFTLHVSYYLSGIATFSGLWGVSSVQDGDSVASDNVLSASSAYDLVAAASVTYYTKEIPLPNTNISQGDKLSILFRSDTSNPNYCVIKQAWIVIT